MLPEVYQKRYEAFYQVLHQLQTKAVKANPDVRALHSDFLDAQQIFQVQIVGLDLEGLDANDLPKVQSYQTEINKQLRLLGTDVMFLQAARQPATAQQRQAQIRDRIDTLLRYCQALLEEQ